MLRIGTRGSQLALWQANTVAAHIAAVGGPPCSIVTIKTSGDRLQEAPLSEIGGKRLFVKEIEDALLGGDIDLAVHSSKDMSVVLPEGLQIAAVLPREDPLDAIVFPLTAVAALPSVDHLVAELGHSPVVGTGSVRRIAQLRRLIPGAHFTPIRGNLDTRLRKLDRREYDVLVLAAAGLLRLGLAARISMRLPATACLPAPGQGTVAIEIREGDEEVRLLLARIDDPQTAATLSAERALIAALGGGCQTPIGALATPIDGHELELIAVVVSPDGSRAVRGEARGPADQAAELGQRVAAQLVDQGADLILAEVRAHQSGEEPIGGSS
ncbi:MAG: hydroxymethylbilane synthase [Acidobacteriota bacterium]